MSDDTATPGDERPFAALLRDLQKGRVDKQLGEQLRELVAAVVETRKAGSLTLRLDVKPQSGNDEVITVTARVAAKVPAYDPPASVFFVDERFDLNRNPANQNTIFDMEDQH